MRSAQLLAGSLLAAMGSPAEASDEAGAIRERVARVASIAAGFTALAGGVDNAVALVESMRDGVPARLEFPSVAPGLEPEVVVIQPPTGPLDWHDVRMALLLARDALVSFGVVRPTGEQLQAVLSGGDAIVPGARVVAFKGVLRMRAEGAGWGRIASERFQRSAVTRME